MQWQSVRAPVLVAVAVVLLAAGVWWGVVGDGEDATPSVPRAGAEIDLTGSLDLVAGCRQDTCRIVARRDGFTFERRPAVLVVVAHPGAGCGAASPSSIHLVSADGIVWSGPIDVVCGDPVGGIERDRAGNVFLLFEGDEGNERDNADERVIVLRISGERVEDFGTFDGAMSGSNVRVRDLDGDDRHEVVVDGTVLRWTGTEWREDGSR